MKRILIATAFCALFWACGLEAYATTITVQQQDVSNFRYTLSANETLYLRIYVDRAFVTSDGNPVQPGGPESGQWYRRITCSIASNTVTVPSFTIDSTTDAQDSPGKAARYSAVWYANNRMLGPYAGFESFRILPSYPNMVVTNATWAQIRADNTANAPIPVDRNTYNTETINRLIAEAVVSTGGLYTLNGISVANQTFANDTNVTISTAGSTHTIGWSGTLAVGRGGVGVGTLASNGVLYGNGTGAVQVTSQGAANSILTANAGAPSFSQTPTINTSLTVGVGSSQTGSIILRNATNANTLTIQPGVTTGNFTFTLPTDDGTSGQFLQTDGSGVLSWAAPSGTISGSGTSGRVTLWNGASAITSDADLVFDTSTDRLSIDTTLTAETVNIPASAYYGGGDIAGTGIRKLIGAKSASRITSSTGSGLSISYGTTATNSADTAPDTIFVHNYTEAGAATLNPLLSYYQPAGSNGMKIVHGVTGSFDDSTSENIYSAHFTARNEGTTPTVALTALALTNSTAGTSGQIIGSNVIAYHEAANGSTLTNGYVVGQEINYGYLGTVTIGSGQQSVGLQIIPYGSAQVGPYIALASGTTAAQPATAMQLTVAGGIDPIANGGRIFGLSASFGTNTLSSGFDLAGAEYSLGAFKAAYGLTNGLFANNSGNTTAYNIASMGTDATLGTNSIRIGQATVLSGIAMYAGNSAESVRITNGNRTGLNSAGVSLTNMLQMQTTTTRALTGTVSTNLGNATVSGSGTAFTTEIRPGNTIRINSVNYEVDDVVSDTSLTLTAGAASTLMLVTAYSDDPMLLIETDDGRDMVEVNGLGTLVLYDDGARNSGNDATLVEHDGGALSIRNRRDTTERLIFGYDDGGDYAYIAAKNDNLGWKDLILQGGSTTGYVGIGTTTPNALLTVVGSGIKTADFIGSAFNNIAISVTPGNAKVGATYTLSGSWTGPVRGLQVNTEGGFDTSGNLTNYPAILWGDGVLVAPPITYGVIYAPTASLHVYGFQARSISTTTDTVAVAGPDTVASAIVAGTGTTWNTPGAADRLRVGDAVRFASDTTRYYVAAVSSDTSITLNTTYGGTSASGIEGYADPVLFKVDNGYGTEKFRVESSGLAKFGGQVAFTRGTAIASAATVTITPLTGNVVHITGVTNIDNISGGEDGQVLILIFDGVLTANDGAGNLALAGNFTTTANDSLTLVYDSGTSTWYEVARSVN